MDLLFAKLFLSFVIAGNLVDRLPLTRMTAAAVLGFPLMRLSLLLCHFPRGRRMLRMAASLAHFAAIDDGVDVATALCEAIERFGFVSYYGGGLR